MEGPISYLFQTCDKLNKTLLRLFTLKPAIKLSNTGKCLKWETVHQRQRRESEKCLYIQKNLRSSIIRLGCNSSRGWRRAKANTNDQSTPIERRQRESPQPPNSLQDWVPSCSIPYDGEISKVRFSGPNRTRFVTETGTPGGSCVNCHNNLQRDCLGPGGYTCQRLEKCVCVCVCACVRAKRRLTKRTTHDSL